MLDFLNKYLMSYNKSLKISLRVVLVLSLSFFISCNEKKENVVAQVGTEHLTVNDLVEGLPVDFRNMVSRNQYLDMVRAWIEQEAMYQAAMNEGMQNDPEYLRLVEENRKKILVDRWINTKVDNQPKVYESEMKSFYEKNRNNFQRSETVYSYRILKARDMKHGWAIRHQITVNGFDHQASYQNMNGNPAQVSIERTADAIPDCMRELVVSSKVGTSSTPFQCKNEVYVVQVDDRLLVGSLLPFVQVKDQVESQLKQEKIKESIQLLASKAKNEKAILTFFEKIPADTLVSSVY